MSHLVLLPDDPPSLTTDDDDDEEPIPVSQQPSFPPLSNSVVLLYLLSPYLRLGAIYASDMGAGSNARSLVALLVAASLSAFCRQIWFLLARYLRKSSTQDILVHLLVRRHPRRGLARYAVTFVTASFRLLLAAMYLRDSVASALLLDLPDLVPSRSRLNVSVLLSILVFVLSLPRSLASKSIKYTTGLSMVSYVAWLLAAYGTHRLARPSPGSRLLWNEISSFTFACTTSMTVPMSASLISGAPAIPPASRNAKMRSFQLLNLFSAMLAAFLMMPVAIIAASPRAPDISDNIVLGFRIATLVLSIPFVVVSITLLPLHGVTNRFIRTDLALSVITLVIFALSLVPPTIGCILDDITLFLAVSGTFLLPALTHIAIHYFRRPLSIVMPQEPSSAVPGSPRPSNLDRSPSPSRDPLLQRKERLLQRRRFGKRLLWDIVVCIVLVPICICALVWATGRLARQW